MVKGLGLNPFATAYILSKTGTFEFFAFEMTSKQREEEFGKVVGEAVIVSAVLYQLGHELISRSGATTCSKPVSRSTQRLQARSLHKIRATEPS